MIGEDKPDELALMVIWHGGDLLVQDRTHDPDGGIGFWGGKIKEGEDPFDAALREAREEIEIYDFHPHRPISEEDYKPIETDNFAVWAFQAYLQVGANSYHAKEGRAVLLEPIAMFKHPQMMEASRAVLRETVLKLNALNDDGIKEIPRLELD
jgi:8-oxo-dGTP pyrophosphatase MutT (NUDIX family)